MIGRLRELWEREGLLPRSPLAVARLLGIDQEIAIALVARADTRAFLEAAKATGAREARLALGRDNRGSPASILYDGSRFAGPEAVADAVGGRVVGHRSVPTGAGPEPPRAVPDEVARLGRVFLEEAQTFANAMRLTEAQLGLVMLQATLRQLRRSLGDEKAYALVQRAADKLLDAATRPKTAA